MVYEPVARGDVDVLGVSPALPGLLDVSVALDPPPPDREWAAMFARPIGTPVPTGLQLPRLSGARVRLRVPDDRIVDAIIDVDARIAAANQRYADLVVPEIAREQAAVEAEIAEWQQRAADAQQAIDDAES